MILKGLVTSGWLAIVFVLGFGVGGWVVFNDVSWRIEYAKLERKVEAADDQKAIVCMPRPATPTSPAGFECRVFTIPEVVNPV